jgi:tetratricopeptide (TPR) repeat protein
MGLRPGDRLRTLAGSRATVRLSDRSVIRVDQSTLLRIEPPRTGGAHTRIRLERGSFFFLDRELPGAVEFETPLATGAIRGTEFLLQVAAEDGATRLALVAGEVELEAAGEVRRVVSGELAEVGPGGPVRVRPGIELSGLIQWCLYYPAVLNPDDLALTPAETAAWARSLAAYREGDLLRAREEAPAASTGDSEGVRAYQTALMLAFGQVEAAAAQLGRLPGSPVAAALRGVVAAVRSEEWTVPAVLATSSEWLAVSHYRQSRADLEGARAAAKRAAELAPGFGLGWARLAELEFGFGRRPEARAALERARALAPRNAQALAMAGYVELARGRARAAVGWFDRAIALDGALGSAWLGRGLSRAQLREAAAAQKDLQTAVVLEPQRALYRSCLGKAWGQAGFDDLAEREFALAKGLDPADPTAWLYSGLHKFQTRQPNEAVRELSRSVELNDNRGVFRSRLLLDQDRAMRSADLAAIYREVGLEEVSRSLATRAVQEDYSGFSGHLLLARSLQVREDPARFDLRLETPRQSELLVANLLAPAGAGNLSQVLSQQDHLDYFYPGPVGMSAYTEYRSDGDWREAGTLFGQVAGLGYAVDGEYLSLQGQGPNSAVEQFGYSLQARQEVGASDSAYLQAGYRQTTSEDAARHYDPADARAGFRVREVQEPALYAGWHHAWSPGSHTLLLAARLPDRLALTNPEPAVLFVRQGGGSLSA